jgi:hypothetical protein
VEIDEEFTEDRTSDGFRRPGPAAGRRLSGLCLMLASVAVGAGFIQACSMPAAEPALVLLGLGSLGLFLLGLWEVNR